jgi:hypothetical protein
MYLHYHTQRPTAALVGHGERGHSADSAMVKKEAFPLVPAGILSAASPAGGSQGLGANSEEALGADQAADRRYTRQ